MRTEEEIKDLIKKIKITNFKNTSGAILVKDVKTLLIKQLEWVLESEGSDV